MDIIKEKEKLYKKWNSSNPEFFNEMTEAVALETALLIENQKLFNESATVQPPVDLKVISKVFSKLPILNHIDLISVAGPIATGPYGEVITATRMFDTGLVPDQSIDEFSAEVAQEITNEFLTDLSVNCGTHVFVQKALVQNWTEFLDVKISELTNIITSKNSEAIPSFIWTDYGLAAQAGWKEKERLGSGSYVATQYEDIRGLPVYASNWKANTILVGSKNCYYYCPYVFLSRTEGYKTLSRYSKKLKSAAGFARLTLED